MIEASQIRIKYIPAIFPNYNFEDRKYVDYRIVKLPEKNITKILTDSHYTKINELITKSQLVQTIVYEQYEIELFIHENIGIDYTKIAGQVTFITDEGDIYNAEVISINYDKVESSYFYHVILRFYAISNDTDAISNYCDETFISNVYGLANVNNLTLQLKKNIDTLDFEGGSTFKIYNIFKPTFERLELKIEEQKLDNGSNLIVNSQDCQVLRTTFFVDETTKNLFKKYAKRAFHISSGSPVGVTFYDKTTDTTYTATMPLDYEISNNKELINLYEIKIEIKYDLINFYHFA